MHWTSEKFYVGLYSVKMLFTTNQREEKDLQGKLKTWSCIVWEKIYCDTNYHINIFYIHM